MAIKTDNKGRTWGTDELRRIEIWNTKPTSPEHRQALIDELAALNEKAGISGVGEFIALLDASEVKKAS